MFESQQKCWILKFYFFQRCQHVNWLFSLGSVSPVHIWLSSIMEVRWALFESRTHVKTSKTNAAWRHVRVEVKNPRINQWRIKTICWEEDFSFKKDKFSKSNILLWLWKMSSTNEHDRCIFISHSKLLKKWRTGWIFWKNIYIVRTAIIPNDKSEYSLKLLT